MVFRYWKDRLCVCLGLRFHTLDVRFLMLLIALGKHTYFRPRTHIQTDNGPCICYPKTGTDVEYFFSEGLCTYKDGNVLVYI